MTSSSTINQNITVLAKQCKADTDHDFSLSSDEKTIFINNTYNRGLPEYNDGLTDLPTNEVTTLNNNMAEGPSKSSATLSTFSDYTETLNATDTITVQNYSPGLPTGQYTVKKILNIAKNRGNGGYLADNDTNSTNSTNNTNNTNNKNGLECGYIHFRFRYQRPCSYRCRRS